MNTFQPKVSIITVCLNNGKFLEETIRSVRGQTYKNIEYIIIDGGSTDGTMDVIKEYEKDIDYWVSEPDNGIAEAFNKGIKASTGEIIGILNAGDWYRTNSVECVVEAFMDNPDAEVAHGDLIYWEADGKTEVRMQKPLRNRNKNIFNMKAPYNHPTMFVKRRVYEQYGLFDTRYKIAMDYDFMLRLTLAGVRFYYLDKIIANQRLGGISSLDASKAFVEAKEIILKHGYSKFKAYFFLIYRIVERRMWHILNIFGSHKVYMFYRKYLKRKQG